MSEVKMKRALVEPEQAMDPVINENEGQRWFTKKQNTVSLVLGAVGLIGAVASMTGSSSAQAASDSSFLPPISSPAVNFNAPQSAKDANTVTTKGTPVTSTATNSATSSTTAASVNPATTAATSTTATNTVSGAIPVSTIGGTDSSLSGTVPVGSNAKPVATGPVTTGYEFNGNTTVPPLTTPNASGYSGYGSVPAGYKAYNGSDPAPQGLGDGGVTVTTNNGSTTSTQTYVPSSGNRMGMPVIGGTFTSPYGMRMHPIQHVYKLHTGLDIASHCGDNVYAAADGIVHAEGWADGDGNRLVIQHSSNLYTTYNHLSAFVAKPGDIVKKGQLIAKEGTTGNSTGCHMHFEVIVNGYFVDPLPWITNRPGISLRAPAYGINFGTTYTGPVPASFTGSSTGLPTQTQTTTVNPIDPAPNKPTTTVTKPVVVTPKPTPTKPVLTPTSSNTPTPTPTPSKSVTPTPTHSSTPAPSPSKSVTSTPTPSATPTAIKSVSPRPSATSTVSSVTVTPSIKSTAVATPSATVSSWAQSIVSASATASSTASAAK